MKKLNLKQHPPLILIAIIAICFFMRPINLLNADIGRHIKNGEIILQNFEPIKTNFYSYTEPGFETITHHWGSGIIFYTVWKLFSFSGLTIFNALLLASAVTLMTLTAIKNSNKWHALLFSAASLPLIATRTEIRPESLSYLFLALFYFILTRVKNRRLNPKALCLLPFLQLIWVNTHIFFVFGIFLIGVFALDSFINRQKYTKSMQTRVLFSLILSSILTLLNPWGIEGALVPLTILNEYGYRLVENQSIFFMLKRFPKPIYIYFIFLAFAIAQIFFLSTNKKTYKEKLTDLTILTAFTALSFKAIRSFPLFGLFLIPIGAKNTYHLLESKYKELQNGIRYLSAFVMLSLIALLITNIPKLGIGLIPQAQSSARFFKQQNLKGPIFNNYDIGGYLIYNLYPTEKVFVDNRPESYSVKFFEEIYIPMQEDEKVWQSQLEKHDFNIIYFWRHDLTPWAQPFLIRRLDDPKWVPVYVDSYTIIFVRNNEENKNVIEKFELPEKIFTTK